MVSLAHTGLRVWTFLWTLLALSLLSNVIADAFAGNPSSVNFSEFVAIFSMLVVLAGIASLFVEALAFPVAIADLVAAVFSIIAGVVLAAKLRVHSCGNHAYLISNSLTNGSHDMGKRCHELQASCAFFFFMCIGFAGSAFFGFRGSSSGMSMRRGGARKGPSMSQV